MFFCKSQIQTFKKKHKFHTKDVLYKNKVDSVAIGRKVIAHLLPRSDLEKFMDTKIFNVDKILSSLIFTIYKLTIDKKIIYILREISTVSPFQRF